MSRADRKGDVGNDLIESGDSSAEEDHEEKEEDISDFGGGGGDAMKVP